MNEPSPDSVLHLVARLAAVGGCLGCLELLAQWLRPRPASAGGRGTSPRERAARWGSGAWHGGLPALVAARLLLGAWLLADPGVGPSWKCSAAGYLAASLLLCRWLPATQGA